MNYLCIYKLTLIKLAVKLPLRKKLSFLFISMQLLFALMICLKEVELQLFYYKSQTSLFYYLFLYPKFAVVYYFYFPLVCCVCKHNSHICYLHFSTSAMCRSSSFWVKMEIFIPAANKKGYVASGWQAHFRSLYIFTSEYMTKLNT